MFTDFSAYSDDEQSSKKKWIAPLVVLLLCFTALTGAAYAYNSTLTTNDDVETQYFTLETYDDSASAAVGIFDSGDKLVFDVVKDKIADTKTYTLSTTSPDNTFTFKVKILDGETKNTAKFTLTSSMIGITCHKTTDTTCATPVSGITAAVSSCATSDDGVTYTVTFNVTGSITDTPDAKYLFKVVITQATDGHSA